MRRIITLVTVALIMASMLMFAGPASAQGGCKEFGTAFAFAAQQERREGGQEIRGLAPLNEEVAFFQAALCSGE